MNFEWIGGSAHEHEIIWRLYIWGRNFDYDLRDVLMRAATARGNRFWCLT